MSIQIAIVGSETQELETLLRAAGLAAATTSQNDFLRMVQPGASIPAVVVIDVRSQAGLPPALPLLKREHPSTGVVIVAAQLDPTLMLEAMRAGVTEWIPAPIDERELVAAVKRVSNGTVTTAKGEVFAVIGSKGGVGATTLAVNIATTLSTLGSTLLVDMHPSGGDAALFLGCEPKFTVLDALQNTHRLDDVFLKGLVVKTKAGPDLLASPDRVLAPALDEERVRTVVDFVSRCYRYVVLDLPRAVAGTEQAMALASVITVVATQELAAIRGAGRIAAQLRRMLGNERVRLVVNRYDRAAEIASDDLEHAVGGRVGFTFPSNYRLAVDALNKGRPVVVDNHNKLAGAFALYARGLAQAPASSPADDRSSGLFGRFAKR